MYALIAYPGLGNCIEMEWMDGVSLSELLKAGRPDRKLFRKLASELCDALIYMHNRQTLHRDIKPSNIMVTHFYFFSITNIILISLITKWLQRTLYLFYE